jgi:hypothetical protein
MLYTDMEVNQQSWTLSNFKHINLFWSIFYSVQCTASHLLNFDVYHLILGICDILIVRMDDIEFLGYLSIVYTTQRIWRCKDDCLYSLVHVIHYPQCPNLRNSAGIGVERLRAGTETSLRITCLWLRYVPRTSQIRRGMLPT